LGRPLTGPQSRRVSFLFVTADGAAAALTRDSRCNVIRIMLYSAGFLLIIILFSEEASRGLEWLRAYLRRSPRHRVILSSLLLLLVVVVGISIVISLVNFATSLTFSYD
jgi:hypothetical protein